MSKTRMFTTERLGLLALAVILLVVIAIALARNYASEEPNTPLTPDPALVKSINEPADTVKASIIKPRKKHVEKKPQKPKKTKSATGSPLDRDL